MGGLASILVLVDFTRNVYSRAVIVEDNSNFDKITAFGTSNGHGSVDGHTAL